MARRTAEQPPSPLRLMASVVRVALAIALGALLILAFRETPAAARLQRNPRPRRGSIALIAGHWQSDSGAVCDAEAPLRGEDTLREVDVNLSVARQVADLLRNEGFSVEVLPEYSPRLEGFRGRALVAIHADSCTSGISGFKIARSDAATGATALTADRLVELLSNSYAAETGLSPHPDTITDAMRRYHAFFSLDSATPGVIIECGFLGGDRELLTQGQSKVARGIAQGLLAFLRES